MPITPKDRMLRLLATARNHPEFAQRVALELPEQLRLSFANELAKPAQKVEAVARKSSARSPGLRKCGAPQVNNGFSAQLNLFARSVSRVS